MAGMGPFVAFVIIALAGEAYGAQYLGKFLGKLSELHHGVSGEVYAVDGRTLYLKDFTYDGQGPAAYFYASSGRAADRAGFRLRDENGSPEVIRRYRKEGVTLTLPEGKTLNSIKIFYVWCEEFEVNFGDVKIPRNFDYPRPEKIEPLKGVHAISSDNIVIVDAQTLLIPHLSYDGEAPDAKFWVGRGPKPSPQGIRVPDENGKEIPLRRYDRKTVVLTLPGDLTIFDIGHFGIWCEAFTVDFGHVQIPQTVNVPPSLKMLGVSPQSKLNCEVLYDDLAFEARWAVAGDSIVLQLVAKLDNGEYMSFGVSGDDSKSEMIGGDVVVAWVDKSTLKGFADDYYLSEKSQCSGPTGSCPDSRLKPNSNNIRLLNAAMVNGYSIVTYQRPLKPSDEFDRQIHTNRSQAVIWAIGPLNQRNEVSFHSHFTKGDQFIDFGRPAKWNCPMPEGEQPSMKPIPQIKEISTTTTTVAPTSRGRNSERRRGGTRGNASSVQKHQEDSEKSASSRPRQTERRGSTRRGNNNSRNTIPTPAPVAKRDAWDIPAIKCYEPEDGVFYAQMGPTGGKRGYSAITGHVGWGISWYINGLLIPEINVVRGKTYTFVVEGGLDPEVAAKYHPFYITDDPVGGFEYKTAEEKKNVRIFAGAVTAKDGSTQAVGTGRLCHWTQQGELEADDFESFGAYQRTLELKCDQGEPGVIQWTPDRHTPDTVYYQCFTHRYLGWKINVHDSCEAEAASEQQTVVVPAPSDLEESPSQRIETRVKLNDIVNSDEKEDSNVNKSSTSVSEISSEIPKFDPTVTTTTTTISTISTTSAISSSTPSPSPSEPAPILIQQQQLQSYFQPPIYNQNSGQFLNSFNPYAFENPFYFKPIQKNSFKPSPPLDAAVTDGFRPQGETLQETSTSASTTSASTSTTTVSTTTSASTTTATAAATISTTTSSSTTTEKPILPQEIPEISEKLIVSASELKPQNLTFMIPNKLMTYPKMAFMRRPQPPPAPLMRRPFRPPPMRYMMQAQPTFKKPIYRPHMKIIKRPFPNLVDPLFFSETQYKRRPVGVSPNFIVIKPNQILQQQAQHQQIYQLQQQQQQTKLNQFMTTPKPIIVTVTNAEISQQQQQQASAEPEIQTAPSTSQLDSVQIIEPIKESYSIFKLKPALNTGFHPESVVVESGFKPIVSKEFQRRMMEVEDEEPEWEYGSERGIIEQTRPDLPQFFEPMFVPSPEDVVKKNSARGNQIQERSLDLEPDVAAAERVESYYLPPPGSAPKIGQLSQRSNIDLEEAPILDLPSPPDVVVTFDGRRVSGASLTAKIAGDRSSIFDVRASKAAELIKARPQFAPFKGELPPLNPEILNKNIPQIQGVGLINRELDTPPFQQHASTKLNPIKERRKRAPHHTPEHTAEQEKNNQTAAATTGGATKLYNFSCSSLVFILLSIFIVN